MSYSSGRGKKYSYYMICIEQSMCKDGSPITETEHHMVPYMACYADAAGGLRWLVQFNRPTGWVEARTLVESGLLKFPCRFDIQPLTSGVVEYEEVCFHAIRKATNEMTGRFTLKYVLSDSSQYGVKNSQVAPVQDVVRCLYPKRPREGDNGDNRHE